MIKRSETSHPQDAMGSLHPWWAWVGLPDHPGEEDGDPCVLGQAGVICEGLEHVCASCLYSWT